MISCWLRAPTGGLVRVGFRGISIGRSRDCDLIGTDPRLSRRHAIVRVHGRGCELYCVRGRTRVNEAEVSGHLELEDGDFLEFPGLSFTVSIEDNSEPTRPLCFVVSPGQMVIRVSHGPYCIGGGPADDFRLPGLPPRSLLLTRTNGVPLIKCGASVVIDGCVLAAGDELPISGVHLVDAGEFGLEVSQSLVLPDVTTLCPLAAADLTRVRLSRLRKRASLKLSFGSTSIEIVLPPNPGNAVRQLLIAASSGAGAEIVDDDKLVRAVWPNDFLKGPEDVNVLIYRLRQVLRDHGVDAFDVLQRWRGGGTRFNVPSGIPIEVD